MNSSIHFPFTCPLGFSKLVSAPNRDHEIMVHAITPHFTTIRHRDIRSPRLSPDQTTYPVGPLGYDHRSRIYETLMRSYTPQFSSKLVVLKIYRSPRDAGAAEHITNELDRISLVLFSLVHDNVVPIYGFDVVHSPLPALVMPLYPKGNLRYYLEHYSRADKMQLVDNILAGIEYLHRMSFPHGNLYYANILISATGRACVSDPQIAYTLRSAIEYGADSWETQPPESLNPLCERDSRPSNAKDVYACASLLYEVYAGRLPFAGLRDIGRTFIVDHGHIALHRPRALISSSAWQVLQQCWAVAPSARPSISYVRTAFQHLPSVT